MFCLSASNLLTETVRRWIFLSNPNMGVMVSSDEPMLDNETYDLMEQLLVENKSLWRIKNNYISDSAMDNETKQIWSVIEKDKQKTVKMLIEKVKARL